MTAGQPSNHQHKRALGLEVIESLSTPSRQRRNRPRVVQTPVSAVAQTCSTSTHVAAAPLRFTLPPLENMSLQDGMDLLECIRVFPVIRWVSSAWKSVSFDSRDRMTSPELPFTLKTREEFSVEDL